MSANMRAHMCPKAHMSANIGYSAHVPSYVRSHVRFLAPGAYMGRTSQDVKRLTSGNFTLYVLGFLDHLQLFCLAGNDHMSFYS